MLRFLYDILIIISVAIWILSLALERYIPPKLAASALFIFIFARAFARRKGGSFSRCIRKLFTISIPITSLIIFIIRYSKGLMNKALLGQFMMIAIIIAGLYVMIYHLFRQLYYS